MDDFKQVMSTDNHHLPKGITPGAPFLFSTGHVSQLEIPTFAIIAFARQCHLAHVDL
jgi:hypothetical protein